MNTTDYTTRANAIAGELGGTAQMNGSTANFYVLLPHLDPDAKLLLRFSPYKAQGRLVVSLTYPQTGTRGYVSAGTYLSLHTLNEIGHVGEITVSLGKSAAQIAADIKRRILPAYLKGLGLVRAELQKEGAELQARDEALKRLAAASGLFLSDITNPSTRDYRLHISRNADGSSPHVTVELHSSDECSISIRWATVDLAEQILKLIAAQRAAA